MPIKQYLLFLFLLLLCYLPFIKHFKYNASFYLMFTVIMRWDINPNETQNQSSEHEWTSLLTWFCGPFGQTAAAGSGALYPAVELRIEIISFTSSTWPKKWERAPAVRAGWGVEGWRQGSKRQASCKVKETLKATGWGKPQMLINYPGGLRLHMACCRPI